MGAWIHPCSTWILADTPWIFIKLGMIMHRSRWQTGVTGHMGNGAHIWHLFWQLDIFTHYLCHLSPSQGYLWCASKGQHSWFKKHSHNKKNRSVQMGLKNIKKQELHLLSYPVWYPIPGWGYPVLGYRSPVQDWGTLLARTGVPPNPGHGYL